MTRQDLIEAIIESQRTGSSRAFYGASKLQDQGFDRNTWTYDDPEFPDGPKERRNQRRIVRRHSGHGEKVDRKLNAGRWWNVRQQRGLDR